MAAGRPTNRPTKKQLDNFLAHMSVIDLAFECNVTKQTVYNWIAHYKKPENIDKEHKRRHSLTPFHVRRIRNYFSNGISIKALAEEFGVSRVTIQKIVNNETWGDIK